MWALLALLALAAGARSNAVIAREKPGGLSYRTRDGQVVFRFQCEWLDENGMRIYITSMPRSEARSAHVLNDGRPYICWEGSCPDMAAVRGIVREWCERQQVFYQTGVWPARI